MPQLLYTVLGEGPSDVALMPIVRWVLEQPGLELLPDVEFIPRFVGPDEIQGAHSLFDRIVMTVTELPGQLLFVHHDADGPTRGLWSTTVGETIQSARSLATGLPPTIPVVPVREMEAWLLIDQMAIREAVGVPRGTAPLGLPRLHEIESCPDPKLVLRQALRAASGLPRRRWSEIDAIAPRQVVELIKSFEPLRQLPAFQAFEEDVRRVVDEQGWPERLG